MCVCTMGSYVVQELESALTNFVQKLSQTGPDTAPDAANESHSQEKVRIYMYMYMYTCLPCT